jgi:hypothetical protein
MTVRTDATLMVFALVGCVRATPEAVEPRASEPATGLVEFEQPPEFLPPEEASAGLLRAAEKGDLDEVRRHAEMPGVNLEIRTDTEFTKNHETHYYTALAFAARHGDLEMFEYLLARGASLEPLTLYAAARGGNIEIVARVMELGVDDPDEFTHAMVHACTSGERDVVEYFLGLGVSINASGWAGGELKSTCLIEAAQLADLEMIEFVLAAGATVNQPDEAGYTALMMAAMEDSLDCVTRLLKAGADPDAKTEEGQRALDLAEEGSEVEALLRRKSKKAKPEK